MLGSCYYSVHMLSIIFSQRSSLWIMQQVMIMLYQYVPVTNVPSKSSRTATQKKCQSPQRHTRLNFTVCSISLPNNQHVFYLNLIESKWYHPLFNATKQNKSKLCQDCVCCPWAVFQSPTCECTFYFLLIRATRVHTWWHSLLVSKLFAQL
jgi:hypothetical protein